MRFIFIVCRVHNAALLTLSATMTGYICFINRNLYTHFSQPLETTILFPLCVSLTILEPYLRGVILICPYGLPCSTKHGVFWVHPVLLLRLNDNPLITFSLLDMMDIIYIC